MFVALLVVVMLASLVGMIVCNKKQNVMPTAKIIAMVLMVVVVVCGVLLMKEMDVFGGSTDSLRANEAKFFTSQGYVVGKFIGSGIGAGKVLLVAENGYENDTRLPQLAEAIKEGMGGGEVVMDTIVLPTNDPNMIEPLMERMSAKDFDALVAKHSDAKVILSMVGVPRDAARMKLFKDAMAGKGPALILVGYSEMPGMGTAIAKGAISAVVTVSPKAVFDEKPAPSDPQEAFNVRYVLVNKDNIQEYASLFGN